MTEIHEIKSAYIFSQAKNRNRTRHEYIRELCVDHLKTELAASLPPSPRLGLLLVLTKVATFPPSHFFGRGGHGGHCCC